MKAMHFLAVTGLALSLVATAATTDEAGELKARQQAAHKERLQQKQERKLAITEAQKTFREFTRELKLDYQQQLQDVETEWQLKQVEFNADHASHIASAEADYKKKLSALVMNPSNTLDEQTLARLQEQNKAYADELFGLRKLAAEELQRELIAIEKRKNALLKERDQIALEKASALGLTDKYTPILATPIGDSLTAREEKWNEKEISNVTRIMEQNQKYLSEYKTGEALRKWELDNVREDFRLTWEQNAEEHALDSENLLYNSFLVQGSQGAEFDQQQFMDKMAEFEKQKQLIKIKYQKIRDQNRIKRSAQRKKILLQ